MASSTDKVSEVDVLIAGAGPVGLFASILLTHMGISHRLIERELEESPLSKALGIHARSMEIFAMVGLVDQFLAAGERITDMHAYINGKRIVQVSTLSRTESTYNFGLFLEQVKTGRILNSDLVRLGGHVERGWELMDTEVDESQNIVITKIRRALDGNNKRSTESSVLGVLDPGAEEEGKQYEYQTIHSKFLIAADGGRSVVRHKLNIPFIGRTLTNRMILFDGRVDAPIEHSRLNFIAGNNNHTLGIFPLSDNRIRVILDVDHTDPNHRDVGVPTLEEFQKLASETAAPLKFEVKTVEWLTYYRVNERVADNYWHKGRIFLAGDACHVHSPAGGQGMNTGLQDVFNLTWKIALVTKGLAKHDILATYEEERKPIAKHVVNLSAQAFAYMFPQTWFTRLARSAILRLGPYIMPHLPAGSDQSRVSMVTIRYHDNLLNQKHPTQAAPSDEFSVGVRARDGPLRMLSADPKFDSPKSLNLHDLLEGPGLFHVLVFTADKLVKAEAVDQISNDTAAYLARWRKRWQLHPTKALFQMHVLATDSICDSLMATNSQSRDHVHKQFLTRNKGDARLYADEGGVVHSRYGLSAITGSGAIIVLRPDSHVGFRVLGTTKTAFDDAESYLTSFLN
ncbi:hypothetical protein BGW42_005090 [Actinomortierella wolfii]|nr:hypothetical protein BGW42_005090 [Actinomortierella wolfii]